MMKKHFVCTLFRIQGKGKQKIDFTNANTNNEKV